MKIAMGCDPNAEEYKKEMIQYVRELGHEVTDFGSEDVIYAHVAQNVAEKVAAKEYDRGILFCGPGIGVMLAAKRACLSNNCNMITLGSQVTGIMLAKELIKAYLECEYVENERSGKKVRAYVEYEAEQFK